MTRWIVLVLAVVALSAVATIAVNYMPSRSGADILPYSSVGTDDDAPAGPPPAIEVEGSPVHNFGLMTQQDKGHKSWKIKNVGTGDLILTGGHPSCSCTLLNLKPGKNVTVKPGDYYDLEVEWETRTNQGQYSKNASLYTNDPKRPELTFIVEGEVEPAIIVYPEEPTLSIGAVENDKPRDYHVYLISPDRPNMKVVGYSSSRPEMFEFSSRELNDEEKANVKAPHGLRVTVLLKPTPVLGPFHEEFVIKTDHPKRPEVHRGVQGTILGPVTFNPSAIRLAEVNPEKGDSATSRISVLGAESTAFRVLKAPEKVKVTIVPVDEKTKDDTSKGDDPRKTIRYYQLTVTVPPGLPTSVIHEDIVLGTDHPRASEIRVPFYAQIVED